MATEPNTATFQEVYAAWDSTFKKGLTEGRIEGVFYTVVVASVVLSGLTVYGLVTKKINPRKKNTEAFKEHLSLIKNDD